ncbi:ETC complex I subunit conserved region-domain-containing protein [Podospora fimiseda]|uniref:ETC complex I subunit conserved region-domain-containing protein n=1 Tax=Podospora fimiseda TaxID=252190 RepID=A0AAN7BXM1_9PEZI|nr:ETC complex I subunit conserved region-domain-containing protein [Podospora fimiseda]
MRATLRLRAAVKPAARYLEAGWPTGLTGLPTHNAPRSMLLYLYNTTLEKLKAAPEHSVYRQSVEALTKHRLALVEATVPPGYNEWLEKAKAVLKDQPEKFTTISSSTERGAAAAKVASGSQSFLVRELPDTKDERYQEWDGEKDEGPELEGSRTLEEKQDLKLLFVKADEHQVKWESEPQLTADQIEELEVKIGAGLIEEVIQVAEGELKLVDTMIKAKVWEPLEEQPAPGQWVYFERKE